MNILTIVKKLCSNNNFTPEELYTFNGGDVYVRYEPEQKEEFNEFLKKLENLWLLLGVANYSIMSYEQLEIRVKGGK